MASRFSVTYRLTSKGFHAPTHVPLHTHTHPPLPPTRTCAHLLEVFKGVILGQLYSCAVEPGHQGGQHAGTHGEGIEQNMEEYLCVCVCVCVCV